MNQKWRLILQVTLSVALVGGLFWLLPADTWTSFLLVDWRWLVASYLCLLGGQVMSAWRLYRLVGGLVPDCRFTLVLRGTFLGYFCSSFLPASVGGDVVKLAWFSKRVGHGGEIFAGMVTERVISFTLTCVVAVITCSSLISGLGDVTRWATLLALGAAVGGICAAVGGMWLRYSRSSWRQAIVRQLQAVRVALKNWVDRPQLLAECAGYSLCILLLSSWGGMWLAAQAAEIPLSLWDALVVTTLGLLLVLFPFTFNGIGVYETGLTACFVLLGYSMEQGIQIALLMRLIVTAVALPGAFFFWGSRKK